MRLVIGFVCLLVACMNSGVDYSAIAGIDQSDRSGPMITAIHFGGSGSATYSAHFASFADMTAATIAVALDTDAGPMTLEVHPSACGGGCTGFDCAQVSAEFDRWTVSDLSGAPAMEADEGSCLSTDGDEVWAD